MDGGYKRYDERQPTYSQQPYVNREQYYSDGEHGYYSQPGVTNEYSFNDGSMKGSVGKKIATAVLALIGVAAIGVTSIVAYTLVVGKNNPFTAPTPDSSINENVAEVVDDSSRAVDAPPVKRDDLPTLEQLAAPEDAMPIPEIIDKMSPSVVGITTITNSGVATGSGIVLSEDGYIITNAHVVSKSTDGSGISVMLHESYDEGTDSSTADSSDIQKKFIKAELVGRDTQSDIAVLKIDRSGLKAATMGTSSELKVGEASIVIGNPLGFELKGSVTAGIISATDRTLTVEDRTMKLIQTDASINNGNSGGPLINAYGQVVGITSVKVSTTYGEGLGFAIPIDEALPIIDDLMKYGYVTGRPTMGISGKDITEIYSQYYRVPEGHLVTDMTSGGPAEQAGIEIGDIIVGINGVTVKTRSEINAEVEKYKAGDTITVAFYRSDKIESVDLVLGDAAETGKGADTQSDNNDYDTYDPYEEFRRFYGGFGF